MTSLWRQQWTQPKFKTQHHDMKTDVLIIGGGMAGILCAYTLHQAGIDYILAESKHICNGISKNTTAKITSQHGLMYSKLMKTHGYSTAKLYLDANEAALGTYRTLCSKIECDFEEKDSYVYSLIDRKSIELEVDALKKLGMPCKIEDTLPIPLAISGAVCFPNQAQFHPLKFFSQIATGLNIYENTNVRELIGLTAITDNGKITANKIIVTTHFPFLNKHGLFPLKLYQHRSYVIALKNAANVNGIYIDSSNTGLSFRNYQDYLLIGGGSHRTGKQGSAWEGLLNFANLHYPGASIKYQWATQDCMSLDGIPYIGVYSPRTDGLYVATGFNKWGVTTSMVAATLLCDMIQNKENPFSQIYSPSRNIFHRQLAVNAFEAALNLITPTTKRCPHMGCALKWNKNEHTWDCPCHGSRFSENGILIDNPSTGDIHT